jgi:hypothetical protein
MRGKNEGGGKRLRLKGTDRQGEEHKTNNVLLKRDA